MNALEQRLAIQLRQAGGGGAKTVVVVEGTGDISFLTLMLDKPPFRGMNLLKQFVIVEAGGKDAVFKTLAARPDYRAMVDRDTWTDEECDKKRAAFPSLYILPRFCIENFIICPDELMHAFPGLEGLNAIAEQVDTGIRHGCLWRAAQPLYDELMQSGFNKALLGYPPPDEMGVKRLSETWQGILSKAHIEKRMRDIYSRHKSDDPDRLLRTFVHGKVFWRGVVERVIAPLFPEVTGERLKTEVLRRVQVPDDLQSFLQEVFS